MGRIARVVVPDVPHHVTQRGNRRQRTFFQDSDYAHYLSLLAQWCVKFGTTVWAYCLMPNHVHLILVPKTQEGLRQSVGEAHRRYTVRINAREGWVGHLWQGRFASFPMDERHLLAAARYIELNPVRSGLTARAQDYPWSSARAHALGMDDSIATVKPLLGMVPDWLDFLSDSGQPDVGESLRYHERTGRPMGDESFLRRVEDHLGRDLHPGRPGRESSLEAGKVFPQQSAGGVHGQADHIGVISFNT